MSATAPAMSLQPWLEAPWRTLSAHVESGRVPQGLLIHGPAGVGKAQLAEALAQRLLCLHPGLLACGDCAGYLLFRAGNHPDFIRVEPPEPGKGIGVDAIRQLCGSLALKPQYGGFRIVLIAPAHLMNANAANALLKTLEEPAERTVLLLLTEHHAQLPATIISRCQRLPVAAPDPTLARQWLARQRPEADAAVLLAAAGGSPLKALALAGSDAVAQRRQVFAELLDIVQGRVPPTDFAERWHKAPDLDDILGWLLSLTADLIRLAAVPEFASIGNADLRTDLQRLAGRLNSASLCDYWDVLIRTRRALTTQANRQLLLEQALIHWFQLSQIPPPKGPRP